MPPPTTPLVQVGVDGRIGRVVLDRPGAINALTLEMYRAIQGALDTWRDDPAVELVVLTGNGSRGFCAGGDIRAVHDGAHTDPESVRLLWREEYTLDAAIASYPKPVVTLAHGITMGGGVGLASHARHRVVTDDVALAMPEVGIGLAPDVGGLWLLARAPGELGTHAALTGARLGAADVCAMGLADRTIPTDSVAAVIDALQDGSPEQAITALGQDPGDSPLCEQRDWIDECYRGHDVGVILERLRSHPATAAQEAADALLAASPTAVAVTLAAIRRAGTMDTVFECLVQDYRVTSHFLEHPDLPEGIRAQVIDKDRSPRWKPGSLAEVDQTMVAAFFDPVGADLDLRAYERPQYHHERNTWTGSE